jgi:predicted ArsR family transcriptional regulator
MDFTEARKLSNYLSKEYAESIFRLLMTYQDISASEAASRLNVHIQTAQEFLETMTFYEILTRQEVSESKRPYFRYRLAKRMIRIEIDLDEALGEKIASSGDVFRIREKKNSGAKFSVARNGKSFSSISVWMGDGRSGKERKINLTEAQGTFLFNLPFPDALPLTADEILTRSDVDAAHKPEILDIVNELVELSVIEMV